MPTLMAIGVANIVLIVAWIAIVGVVALLAHKGAMSVAAAVSISVVALLVSQAVYPWLTIRLMETWASFTADFWTVFWISLLALVVEIVCTSFLGPLSLLLFVLVSWLMIRDRARPTGPRT